MQKNKKKVASTGVTELLHEDHRLVRDLFFQFQEAEDNKEKKVLVQQILKELFIHSTVEEEIVYPSCAEAVPETEDLVNESENEHRVVKFLMAELSQMNADSEQFEAKVTVLCELVNHHIKEEEKQMFKKLRESGADLQDLAEQVMARKEELSAEPIPAMEAYLHMGNMELENTRQSVNVKNLKTKSTRGGRKQTQPKRRKSA